jgi:hypothetical protein
MEARMRKPRGLCLHDGQNLQVPFQGPREDLEGAGEMCMTKETITNLSAAADRERTFEGRQPVQFQHWWCD